MASKPFRNTPQNFSRCEKELASDGQEMQELSPIAFLDDSDDDFCNTSFINGFIKLEPLFGHLMKSHSFWSTKTSVNLWSPHLLLQHGLRFIIN